MTQPVPPSTAQVTLDQPLYGASLPDAVRRFFAKYAVFSGRASRSEYWWWALVVGVVGIVFSTLWSIAGGQAWLVYYEYSKMAGMSNMAGYPGMPGMDRVSLSAAAVVILVLYVLWALATLVPNLALIWRRLHDAGYSGAFWLLVLIPIVGPIIVFVFTLLPPNPRGARFDRSRKA